MRMTYIVGSHAIALALALALAGCGDKGDDSASDDSVDSADGGMCSISITATVCGDELATWVDDGMPGDVDCGGSGGSSYSGSGTAGTEMSCEPNPPAVDEDAAHALCEDVCDRCSCALGSYQGCEYSGVNERGEHEFSCHYGLGCAAGGCS